MPIGSDRIVGEARSYFDGLKPNLQRTILEALSDSSSMVLESRRGVIECWLNWTGIIGFTDDLISLIK